MAKKKPAAKPKKPVQKAAPDEKRCHFCKKPATDEHYCFGCRTHVCNECDVNMNMPMGSHPAALHRVEDD